MSVFSGRPASRRRVGQLAPCLRQRLGSVSWLLWGALILRVALYVLQILAQGSPETVWAVLLDVMEEVDEGDREAYRRAYGGRDFGSVAPEGVDA